MDLGEQQRTDQKGRRASVTVDDGRTVVHIRNKYILQKRANLKSIPSMPVNGDGGEGGRAGVPFLLLPLRNQRDSKSPVPGR